MRPHAEEIRRLGGTLVFIGNGAPEKAKAFREEHQLEEPLYTDPTRAVHRAAGFKHGVGSSVSPRALIHGIKARLSGFTQEFVAGDPYQQGGVFVVAPGDEVLFAYRSREAGDHPAPETVVAALRRWAERPQEARPEGR